MYKHLPIVHTFIALLFFVLITPHAVFAATTTTQKQYHSYWQLITLKEILTVQANSSVTTTSSKVTTTPTPTVKISRPTSTTLTKNTSPTYTQTSPTVNTPTPTKTQSTPTNQPGTSVQTNDVTSYIMNEINKYRASLGLAAVQTSDETCNFAKIRAQEITSSFTHDGFNNRVSSHTLPYAHWTSVTENIAMTSDYKQVETMWQNSPGHAENMRANTPYVCVMQSGNYFAYEGMKP